MRFNTLKFSRKSRIRIGIVAVFSLAVTGVAAYVGNIPVDAQPGNNNSLRAGIALAMDAEDAPPLDLTAGVADALMDTTTVKIADTGLSTVSQGIADAPEASEGQENEAESGQTAEPETEQEPETEPEKKNAAELCGYDNLGIANIKEGNLNIREEATVESKVAGKMTKHNACEILEQDGDWLKVRSGKVNGYVKAEYILTADAALAVAEEELIKVATVTGTATLRVREETSTDSATLALVGEGEGLVVEEEQEGWYYVEVDDEKGYISGDYVEISWKLPTAQTIRELTKDDGYSDVRMQLVQYALQFVGNRYVWGGTSLTNGVDCSGFTMQVYAHFGIGLPHHSGSQPGYGTRISAGAARPGDLFFYGSGNRIGHVGIYIGNGQIVHASNERTGIKVSNAYYRTPICVVSYLP